LYQGGRPQINSSQEVYIVEDVGHNIPWIYAVVEYKKADHQATIIEMEGKIYVQFVSILVDHGSNYSYVNPELMDKCGLRKDMHAESWLAYLATHTNKRVLHWIKVCAFEVNGMPPATHMNVLPLGSYNMLLCIYWLYLHRTKVYFYEKVFQWLDDNGKINFCKETISLHQ